jgi:glycosyltransferase involved in cell wall biosynthesis
VAINARAAVRREIGGVERVARELAKRLPELHPGRYRVHAPRPALAHGRGHAWEQLALPVLGRHSQIVLNPANLAPLAGTANVVMIYDVAPFLGQWYTPGYARWHRFLLPRIARAARLVITTSDAVADQIAGVLGVDRARVATVPLGVDERFRNAEAPAALRGRLGLDRPYVVAVGTDLPRKNLALLDRVAPGLGAHGLDVVLAGSTRGYMPRGRYGIRSLGYVPEADLPGLYAGAAALAMPSLYEGFGLPCLEAMAAGTPVVAADRGALPQTCGPAAVLVDPDDEEAFAAALVRVAAPGDDRARLVAAGHERASRFTWARTARAVDGLLADLLT